MYMYMYIYVTPCMEPPLSVLCICVLVRECVCVSPHRVNHSKNAIVKPQGPTPQEERREVEEAMKRIKEANKAIAKAIDVETPPVEGEYYVVYINHVCHLHVAWRLCVFVSLVV